MTSRALAVALLLSWVLVSPAYAAVENVKVSGDITVRGFARDKYTQGGGLETNTYNSAVFAGKSRQSFFTSQVRVRVNADLSQHISGEVELMNQRVMDAPASGAQGSALSSGTLLVGTAPSGANDQFNVLVNLANITIKELYYPELTVKIGRQNIQWGEGFVIGNSQLGNPDPANVLPADEFTQFTSFDAIRAMINKNAWHFDMFAAKVQENNISAGDDENAMGINIGRTFDSYKAEGEVYFIADRNANPVNVLGNVFARTEGIYAHGLRGSIRPWDRLKLSGETVIEYGREGGATPGNAAVFTPNGAIKQQILAWAFDFRAEYDWKELVWPTTFGTEWVYYSGEGGSEKSKSNNYRPLFRGKFHSAIREFQGYFYFPNVGVTPGYENEHQLMFDALFHPFNNKDLTLFTRWLLFWLDDIPVPGRGRFIGNEWDAKFMYDYTEDLKFSLIGALYWPGSYFKTNAPAPNSFGLSSDTAPATAKELVAEVALAF